ncbi:MULTISPECIES: type VI secretion system TssO [Zobellia]|uniref:type VI secretion system TssO n=1 Tax=Zobellia TaxID=112040 RepID=UPI001BFF46D1|nr:MULTISPECIES: type VI secretion system TssO [Zobellia]MBT9188741.1 type VI secretion system transmembrane protein TssO [Zobellia russellii]MBU2976048.1 type VI secretion system transmembrane protein TssO [Zobellia sp. B3R18]
MEILNKKERTSSFLLFLLMFAITVGILFTAFFYSYKLPWKENAVLREDNKKMQYEFLYQKKFIKALEGVDKQIDSLDTVKEGWFFVEQSIIKNLIDLRSDIPKDSLDDRSMYENLVLTYNKLVDAKRDLKQVESARHEINELEEQVADYEKEISRLNTALDLAKRMNRN